MTDPASQETGPKEFPVRWAREDWDRLMGGLAVMNEREHLNLKPTDFIRTAVRRLAEELLGPTNGYAADSATRQLKEGRNA